MTDQQEKVEAAIAGLEAALEREWPPARHKTDLRTLLSAYQAQAGEIQATREMLGRAMEELRLIRSKDCGAVYDTLLRTDAHQMLFRSSPLSPPATEGGA